MQPISSAIGRRPGLHIAVGAFALVLGPLLPLRAEVAPNLKTRWRARQIAARKAEEEYHNARLAREIAEIAVRQYIECIFPQELATVDAEIKRADSELKWFEDQLDWVRNHSYKGFPPPSTTSDELKVKKARFALEQAQSKKKLLVDYTRLKRARELKGEFDKARANELARYEAWKLERLKELALEQQIGEWRVIIVNRGAMNKPTWRTLCGVKADGILNVKPPSER